MKNAALSIVILLIGLSGLGLAQKKEKPRAYTDPGKTDADFPFQGEYSGPADKKAFGVQVVALGNGEFDYVIYPGGLPGDGWDGDKANRKKGKAKRSDDHVIGKSAEGHGIVINGEKLKLTSGEKSVELAKIVRKSPTLGAKPPKNAKELFDGKSADHFKNGKITEDGLLMQGVTSKNLFQRCRIHIEFRLPYMPAARGQGRGNSGFYAQGRYEVQMLDSFGLEGEHNECGGIYTVGPPKVNMCFPPLSWQTYDVDFTPARFDADGRKTANARMTVRHNGVLIHNNIEIDHSTTASPLKEGPQPGPVYLQDHGNPVRYRNIWVLPLAEKAEDVYLQGYLKLADADRLTKSGRHTDAYCVYRRASEIFDNVARDFPNWSPEMVDFRRKKVRQNIRNSAGKAGIDTPATQ